MDYLSDVEKEQLVAFNQNPILREAVKKVLLAGLNENGVLKAGKQANMTQNAALYLVSQAQDVSNEALGADLRAYWNGLKTVENAFNKISEFIPEVDKKKPINNAR